MIVVFKEMWLKNILPVGFCLVRFPDILGQSGNLTRFCCTHSWLVEG